jgi:hypothetical protein
MLPLEPPYPPLGPAPHVGNHLFKRKQCTHLAINHRNTKTIRKRNQTKSKWLFQLAWRQKHFTWRNQSHNAMCGEGTCALEVRLLNCVHLSTFLSWELRTFLVYQLNIFHLFVHIQWKCDQKYILVYRVKFKPLSNFYKHFLCIRLRSFSNHVHCKCSSKSRMRHRTGLL